MNRAWCCGVLALMLSGCTLPFPLSHQHEVEPELPVVTESQQLNNWLQLSATVMHSSEAERQQALRHLQQTSGNELKQALWLSHPRATNSQRQQAQQLLQHHLSQANTQEQQFFGVYQAYNQEILQQQRQLAERQQQVANLTRKLKELANIDQQINERKFRE
ncbi:hypothetical protein GCM10011502_12700 [Oceanisphaera marina]|uniref:DUF3106 domain-containing protein n=1 Tax=Oceanisphaera marina TaxID=2017550 RepID=A0ABQ1IKQ3_9GAMM|nr:hypothetical protein [Oceanisphaera marina]GGB40832.1 hypothetical protein GCM10011502_12700 [Oceanisphaera marina]